MTWTGWRGALGGGAAMLLLAVTTPIALAQTDASNSAEVTAPKPVKPVATARPAKPAKSPATKAVAKKSDTTDSAKRLAAAKPKAPTTKLAAAPKKPASGKAVAVAAKKQAAPTKTAANAPKPVPSAHAVGTVSYASMQVARPTASATRLAAPIATIAATSLPPPAPTAAPPPPQITATPASLTLPAATAAQSEKQSEKMTPPAKTATSSPAAARPIEPATSTVGPAALPPDPGSAPAFVSDFLKEAFRIAKADGKSPLQRRAELADLFAGKMDVKFIAGYTTADELAGASADVQQRFRAILVNYLVETYYPRVELAADPSITVDVLPGQPFADGTSVVWTTFTKKGWGSQSIKWRLAAENGDFKIVDILSAGASVVQMERDTFRSVMRNGGLKELMAQLDARTKQLAAAN
jgi:ABC-type transporter MlaC component